MHSCRIGSFVFHYNYDFSGDVEIQRFGSPDVLIKIPASTLLAFIANHIRKIRIEAIEEMDDDKLLLG